MGKGAVSIEFMNPLIVEVEYCAANVPEKIAALSPCQGSDATCLTIADRPLAEKARICRITFMFFERSGSLLRNITYYKENVDEITAGLFARVPGSRTRMDPPRIDTAAARLGAFFYGLFPSAAGFLWSRSVLC